MVKRGLTLIAIRPPPSRTQFGFDADGKIWCLPCQQLAITKRYLFNIYHGWWWYECAMCGRIDFYDSTWERRKA